MHHLDSHSMKRKLDGNCTKMLNAVWNKYCKQHSTKQQLYCLLLPIWKNIVEREDMMDTVCEEVVLLSIPTHEHSSVIRPAMTYIAQLLAENGCRREDLLGAMREREREKERESERERESNLLIFTTAWWYWWFIICLSWTFHLFVNCFKI